MLILAERNDALERAALLGDKPFGQACLQFFDSNLYNITCFYLHSLLIQSFCDLHFLGLIYFQASLRVTDWVYLLALKNNHIKQLSVKKNTFYINGGTKEMVSCLWLWSQLKKSSFREWAQETDSLQMSAKMEENRSWQAHMPSVIIA